MSFPNDKIYSDLGFMFYYEKNKLELLVLKFKFDNDFDFDDFITKEKKIKN